MFASTAEKRSRLLWDLSLIRFELPERSVSAAGAMIGETKRSEELKGARELGWGGEGWGIIRRKWRQGQEMRRLETGAERGVSSEGARS